MKKIFNYALLAALCGMSFSAQADSVKLFSFEVPESAVGETTSFSLSATDGQKVQVDWGNGTLTEGVAVADDDVQPWSETEFTGTVAGTTVTVYGENLTGIKKASLNVAVASTAKKTAVSFEKLEGLTSISLGYNNLTTIDVSNLPALTKLDVPDNQLTSVKLAAGDAKNETLININVSNSCNVATGELNPTAGNNQVLGTDWSICPNLTTLNVAGNSYHELGWFDTFDISSNVKLTTLNVNLCDLPSINIAPFTGLYSFNAQWNGFTGEFDLSTITAKSATVFLGHNYITSIKLPDTSTDKMTRLNIVNNNLTFATLPAPGMTKAAGNYVVAPQNDLQVSLSADNELDLTAQAKVGDAETVFALEGKDAEGTALTFTAGDNYTIADGLIKLNVPVKDLVVSMTNSTFSGFTLKTLPATSLSLIPDAFSFEIGEAGQKFHSWGEMSVYVENEAEYMVNYGDGVFVPVEVAVDSWSGSSYFMLEGETKGTKLEVKGDPANITRIDYSASNYDENPVKVKTIDLSKLANLTQLTLGNGLLENIDLTQNQKLTSVSLCSNKLTAFDQALPELAKLNLSNANSNDVVAYGENAISTFDFSKFPALTDLDLSFTGYQMDWSKAGNLTTISMNGNGLTSADLSACPNLASLYLRWNKLTVLDFTPVTTAIQCYAIDNDIEEIKLPEQKIGNLYIKGNKLTFATLPALDKVGDYTNYAPQQPMAVETAEGKVDLSSQAKVGDVETVFAWAIGEEPFTAYTVENGVFTFNEAANQVVCSMTNAAFEKLTLQTVALDVQKASSVADLEAAEGEALYFNFQGVRVSGNEPGLYIRVLNGKADKVVVK